MSRYFILFIFHFTLDINVLLTFVVARVQLFEKKGRKTEQRTHHLIISILIYSHTNPCGTK